MSLLLNLPSPNPPPVLSTSTSVATCSLFTLSYVGGLYLSRGVRVGARNALDEQGNHLSRDHPKVILARLKVASSSTLLSLVGTGFLLRYKGAIPQTSSLFEFLSLSRLLGLPLPVPSLLTSAWIPTSPPLAVFLAAISKAAIYPLLLTALLYSGPLYVSFLEQELPGQKAFDYQRDVASKWKTLQGIRNYIIGPPTEEVVFRACILSTMYFSGASKKAMIFASPLYFGVAHLHHAWGTYVAEGRTTKALKKGLLQACLQFLYTGVFGWYGNFVFMRTGTIWGSLLSHVFCNIMGLPNPFQAAQWHPNKAKLIHLVHLLGIVGFTKSLFPLTEPCLFGGSVYWS